MSASGTKRQIVATQQLGRFQTIADIHTPPPFHNLSFCESDKGSATSDSPVKSSFKQFQESTSRSRAVRAMLSIETFRAATLFSRDLQILPRRYESCGLVGGVAIRWRYYREGSV